MQTSYPLFLNSTNIDGALASWRPFTNAGGRATLIGSNERFLNFGFARNDGAPGAASRLRAQFSL